MANYVQEYSEFVWFQIGYNVWTVYNKIQDNQEVLKKCFLYILLKAYLFVYYINPLNRAIISVFNFKITYNWSFFQV